MLPLDPPVRGIDREIVRGEFYAQTPVDGTEAQKQQTRRKRFNRALERACEKQLVGIREIGTTTYLWLQRQQADEGSATKSSDQRSFGSCGTSIGARVPKARLRPPRRRTVSRSSR
jgi:hypothetical protein